MLWAFQVYKPICIKWIATYIVFIVHPEFARVSMYISLQWNSANRTTFESNNCCLICLVNLYKCCISGLKQHLHGLIWELILFLIELKEIFAVKIDQTIRVVLIWRQDIILQIKHGLSCYMSSPYTISLRLVFCLQVWFNIAYLRTCVPRNSNKKKLNRSNRQQCIWVYK